MLLDFCVKQTSQYETYMNFFFQHRRSFPQSISQKHDEALITAVLFKLVKRQDTSAFATCGTSICIQQPDFSALPSHYSNLSEVKSIFLRAELIPIVWHLLRAKTVRADKCCTSAEPQQLPTPWKLLLAPQPQLLMQNLCLAHG